MPEVYARIVSLCKEKKISIHKLEMELGLSSGLISKWQKVRPTAANLSKVASYFGVSLSYLLNGEELDLPPYYIDEEAAKTAQELLDNRELRLLFDAAKDARPEDLTFCRDLLLKLKGSGID